MILKKEIITKKPVRTIEDFLYSFPKFRDLDLHKGISFHSKSGRKIKPSIQLAKPSEAKEITQIFKEVYRGSYPYKELEDEIEVQKMIRDPDFHWIVFKINADEIIGCTAFHVDIENKSGTFHGFAIKRKNQGLTDLVKLSNACLYSILKLYKNKVLLWYCEVRSAHTKSQYMGRFLGLDPIAFLPNKDIFFNREESEFIYIMYDKEALQKYRSKETPKIPHQVLKCYHYAFKKYNLVIPIIKNPELKLNESKVREIKNRLIKSVEKDRFGNELITISIKNSESYIKFLHHPLIQTIEQTTYGVDNIEELFVFIEQAKYLMIKLNIRYFECFVSSYIPTHQIIFLNAGLKPTGYIPSWRYNKQKRVLEDIIVFVYCKNEISKNIKLIIETEEFLKTIYPNWDIFNK